MPGAVWLGGSRRRRALGHAPLPYAPLLHAPLLHAPHHGIGRRHPGDVHPRGAGCCAAAWRAQKPMHVCARAKQEVAEHRPTWHLHTHMQVQPALVCTHTCRCSLSRCIAVEPGGRPRAGSHMHTHTYMHTFMHTHTHAHAHMIMPAPSHVLFFCLHTRLSRGIARASPPGPGALPLSRTVQWTQGPAKIPPWSPTPAAFLWASPVHVCFGG